MSLDRFRPNKKKIDYLLFFLIIGLIIFGLLMVYSSSAVVSFEQFGYSNFYFRKQLVSFGVGLVLMFITMNIDYKIWKKYAVWFLYGVILLLICVLLFSQEVYGAQRWIRIAGLSMQPSEITKWSFIVYLAAWLDNRKEKIKDFQSGFLPFVIIVGIIGFLIIAQPDMGTMSVIIAISLVMLFVSGAKWTHMGAGLVGLFFAFLALIKLEPYRMQRLLVFLNPSAEASGAGYHINQALLAIGSGGLFGLGFGQSRQKYLYLPEAQTDSIFAVITEELGFLRAMLLFGVFLFVVLKGFKIAKTAPDNFAKLLATGFTAWIMVQFFINIGAMLGLLPLTGIPLPFISYGGTSLMMLMAGVGILLNISKYTTK